MRPNLKRSVDVPMLAVSSSSSRTRVVMLLLFLAFALATNPNVSRRAHAAGPHTVAEWNAIAENAVVRSGAFQNEGLIYMAYVAAAVYNAVVAIEGGYEAYGAALTAPAGASADAAVVEAAYRTLVHYFPAQAPILDPLYASALDAIPPGQAKDDGQAVGLQAANDLISLRTGDGRLTPIGTTSSFPLATPGPAVWRLTPPAFAAPQTPWVAKVVPFVLTSADQFLPDAPPSLSSLEWIEAFNDIKLYGRNTSTARSAAETRTALFWTANVIRQYNRAVRDIVRAEGLSLADSARLQAMVNVIGADAQISVMHAKYHFLFWRPVSAIDPTAVKPAPGDGFGPIPGYDDGNAATVEETGWRPLAVTPNHPEYPAAHGSITSAMAEVFSSFLGTNRFELTIRGFDPDGPGGNLNAVRNFKTPAELRNEIIDARLWAGLHYRFSSVAGVVLGRKVARFDLQHAFRRVE